MSLIGRAVRRSNPRKRVHEASVAQTQPVMQPAPIRGLNSRDALTAMDPSDAITLTNFVPGVSKVILRKGQDSHATNVGAATSDVKSLMGYKSGTTEHILGAASGKIYNVTTAGSATTLGTGKAVDVWQHVNFDSKLGMVNGTDTPLKYDGSALSTMTLTGSGLTAANVIGIFAHESRTYFWEDNSQDFWYSSVNTLGGSLTKFPLSRVGSLGGKLVCAGSWNVSGGGEDWGGGGIGQDVAVFVLAGGQAVCYVGDDPGSGWALLGVYNIGEPVHARAISRVGGDLLVLTDAGLISMTAVVGQKSGEQSDTGRAERAGMMTDRIRPTISDAVHDNKTSFGWQVVHSDREGILILNQPLGTAQFDQYIMRLQTGAWAHWDNIDAACWLNFGGDLYFGGLDGTVYKYSGTTEKAGSAIAARGEQAFMSLGGKAGTCKAIKLVLTTEDQVTLDAIPQFDYERRNLIEGVTLVSVAKTWAQIDPTWSEWNTVWSSADTKTFQKWMLRGGQGEAIGGHVRISSTESVEWHATGYRLTIGEALI